MRTIPLSCEAREALILDTMPIVKMIAGKVFKRLPSWIEFEELVSEGYVGLVKAANQYDEARGKFKSFAGRLIYGAIIDYLRIGFNRSAERNEDPLDCPVQLEMVKASTGDCSRLVELREAFRLALARMKPRERECVYLHHMIGESLKSLGQRWGVSESRAIQVWTSGLKRGFGYIPRSVVSHSRLAA
jgi:RNA polymerase sigma factor (sigma-70 family)